MSLGWISDYQIGLKAGGILLLVWSALIFKRVVFTRALHRVSAGFHVDPLSIEVAEKVFSVVIYFMGLLLLLQVFGIDVVPILTVSGIGAAALALAGRDVIANLVGGAVLYASRSFAPSDFIELPGKKIEGSVEKIGWYFTTLRDAQGRPIYIPNSLFSTELILNHSRITRR
ncbi:MAG TPA: mechanosensitive ion channel domain-containing protein [Chlamydiales bacterium]|nr:mechanosensitive ion channel domain-containing protein [Chlamydiales bacterium]